TLTNKARLLQSPAARLPLWDLPTLWANRLRAACFGVRPARPRPLALALLLTHSILCFEKTSEAPPDLCIQVY
ncbi:hypothetical protein COCVIDRAFT_92590, partial [Bipolaris victoriae FI3]